MKILVVTPYYYPEGGGLENYAHQVNKRLNNKKFKILSISLGRENCNKNIERVRIIKKKYNFVISNTPVRIKFIFDILKLLKSGNFDLIHAHMPVPFAADMAMIASKIKKIPLIITYHSSNLIKGINWIDAIAKVYKLFEYFTLKNAVKIIAVAENIRYNLPIIIREKTEIITPGVDTEIFRYRDYHNRVNNKILFIGGLEKAAYMKGLDILLLAFKEITKVMSNIELAIAGSGNNRTHYKRYAEKLGVAKQVNFLGQLSAQQLAKEYQESKVVAIPTINEAEGSPTVMFEAAACGTAIVASRIAGIPQVIKDGFNGLLVSPKNHKELKAAIIKVLKDKQLSQILGNNGYKLVKDKYTWEKIANRYEALYQGILTN